MKQKIVYRYDARKDTVYLNIIGRFACLNSCIFCGKPSEKDTDYSYPEDVYGEGLYLPESPKIEVVYRQLEYEIEPTDKLLAFVGLGEPLLYFPKVLKIIRKVKQKYNLRTKVDTCGLIEPFFSNAAERLAESGLDEIYISLNAVNAEEYNELCRPKIENAFAHLIDFLQRVNKTSIETYVSFILDFQQDGISTRPKKEYLKFAKSLGLKEEQVKWRVYAPV
ncbi:MAG: radical SAM protein [Victivallales bacterium]|nr:radical SAM protein [Victivallales bacterium]